MIDLVKRQELHELWVKRNFKDTYELTHHPFLGLVEEVGELAHAHLKCEQMIRGSRGKHEAQRRDAVGDIVVFLLDYCNRTGLNLEDCILDAHKEVLARDWVSNPEEG